MNLCSKCENRYFCNHKKDSYDVDYKLCFTPEEDDDDLDPLITAATYNYWLYGK